MRVLLVGLGSIARKHIAALRKIDPAVQLVAWRSSRGGASLEGVADVYSLPVGETFDFAIVSNPTACHAATVRELLALNIPLYIEKPVFADLGHNRQRLKGIYIQSALRSLGIICSISGEA